MAEKIRLISIDIDGTGNHPYQHKNSEWVPTNIWRNFQTISNILRLKPNKDIDKDLTVSMYYHIGVGAPKINDNLNYEHRVFNNDSNRGTILIQHCDMEGSAKHISKIKKNAGKAIGYGFNDAIIDCYKHISEEIALAKKLNQKPIITVSGYSRGAAACLAFLNMLDLIGPARVNTLTGKAIQSDVDKAFSLYKKFSKYENHPKVKEFVEEKNTGRNIDIAFLGLYDTVTALGIPNNFPTANKVVMKLLRNTKFDYGFYNFGVPKNVKELRHVLAANELRPEYTAIVFNNAPEGCNVEQRIFPVSHKEAGGGSHDRGLSDITMQWISQERQLVLNKILGDKSINFEIAQNTSSAVQKYKPNAGATLIDYIGTSSYFRTTYKLHSLFKSNRYMRDFNKAATEDITIDKSVEERKLVVTGYEPKAHIPEGTYTVF